MMQDPKKKEVGEMGKPSLKAKFEAAMQKKFDSDNKKKAPKEDRITRMVKEVKEVKAPLKNKVSRLSMMTKLKY
jgi:hypothetical protein